MSEDPSVTTQYKRLKSVLPLAMLAILWLLFFSSVLLAPWIGGYDSVTRLYHIDKIIIAILGNPWLPLLQLILKCANFFVDSPQVYKCIVCLFALTGMLLAFQLLTKTFHISVAAFFSLVFFMLLQWEWVATSIYMEAPFFCFLMLAIHYSLKDSRYTTAFFIVLASFCRPEALLAAPVLLIFNLWYFKNWKRSLGLAVCFIPVSIFYVVHKLNSGLLQAPSSYEWRIAERLWHNLCAPFLYESFFQVIAFLAVCGVSVLCFNKEFCKGKRRLLLGLLPALAGFLLIFVFILPFAHSFGGGSTRSTLFLTIPAMFYASLFIYYWYLRYPIITEKFLFVSITALLCFRYHQVRLKEPWSYRAAQEVIVNLEKKGYAPPGELQVCTLEGLSRKKGAMFELYYQPILLYLRFAGWELKLLDCENDAKLKKAEKLETENPLLRFYRLPLLSDSFSTRLRKTCTYKKVLRRGKRIMGDVCF